MKQQTLTSIFVLLSLSQPLLAADPPQKLPFTLSKETTAITSPLRPDGTPDYVAALNEKYGKGVTPDNNAFIAWLAVSGIDDINTPASVVKKMLAIQNAQPPAAGLYWISYTDFLKSEGIKNENDLTQAAAEFEELSLKFWKPAAQIHPAAYLEAQEALFARAIAASFLKNWWMPAIPADSRSMTSVYIPAQRSLREVSTALCVRAMMKADASDFDGALADLLAVNRIASLASSGPTLLEGITAATIDTMANRSLGVIVGTGQLTQAQCAQLQEKLKSIPPRRPFVESIDLQDRWSHLDSVQAIAVGNVPSIQQLFGEKNLAHLDRSAVDWNLILKDINAAYDRSVEAAKSPRLDAIAKSDDERNRWAEKISAETDLNDPMKRLPDETPKAYSQRIGRYLLSARYSYYREPIELERHTLLMDHMLTLLLTAAQQKAKTGTWPASLADLSPAPTPTDLQDLYPIDSPGTLHYESSKQGARIFSSGPATKPLTLGIP